MKPLENKKIGLRPTQTAEKARKETIMTQREFFTAIINANVAEELKEFAQNGIEKLDARNEKRSTSLSKTQKENAPILEAILNFINGSDELVSSNTIATTIGITTAKASSLAGKLAKEGKIVCKEKALKAVSGKGKVNGYGKVVVKDIAE